MTMTWSDTAIADATYEDRKQVFTFPDNTATGRYDQMIRDFHAYIIGAKENPFTYAHDYLTQQVLDEIVGGVGFRGRDAGALSKQY